ncbi:FAD-dependent oxidoreductase [Chloroflexota bacterium]
MMSGFERLFQPIRIGQMELKNRIVMPGMGTNLATEDGFITQESNDYYEERAKGGCGMVIVEVSCVDYPRGKVLLHEQSIDDDKFLPGLSTLAASIQRHGARASIQLHHGGRASMSFCGGESVGPSPILSPEVWAEVPRELGLDEIAGVVDCFARGAKRAKRAGFDGVEIHAGHSYIINNFLSSASNRRSDAYGGELKNRARLLLEIIEAVRGAVGAVYPVWCRVNGTEYGLEGGITSDEARQVARMLEQAGVDAINVSANGYGLDILQGPMVHYPGNLIPLAEGIREMVNIPVMVAGRIAPSLAELALREGKADIILMGRRLIADPELPRKLSEGRLYEVRPCIYCYVCFEHIWRQEKLRCTVNPAAGREGEHKVQAATEAKRVLVVGGGPAGMEAAKVAAERGHRVTLCEKGKRLGGTLRLVSILKSEIENLVSNMRSQLEKCGVEVIAGREVTEELLDDLKPNAAVVAVGPRFTLPHIPGIGNNNVLNGVDIRRMIVGDLNPARLKNLAGKRPLWYLAAIPLGRFPPSVLRRFSRIWLPFGKRVVIIGGDRPGCEIAEFLAARGKEVTIIERGRKLAKEEVLLPRRLLLSELERLGVVALTNARCEEITEKGVKIVSEEGAESIIEADTVILAISPEPNTELVELLRRRVTEVYLAGDCSEPGGIRDAVSSGAQVAKGL